MKYLLIVSLLALSSCINSPEDKESCDVAEVMFGWSGFELTSCQKAQEKRDSIAEVSQN